MVAQPIVSVILPVYNREQFLSAAIDSVLQQTFERWELVIVDDGSTDSSAEIATAYSKAHPEHVMLLSQENGGVVSARNRALRHCRGRYIAFLDSDDLYERESLDARVRVLEENPGASFVYSGYSTIDTAGRKLQTHHPDSRFQGSIYEKLWLVENDILGATLMIPRDKVDKAGAFDPRLKGAENLDFRLRLARHGPAFFCSDSLYQYRKHRETLTNNRGLMLEQHAKLLQIHFSEHGELLSNSTRSRILGRHLRLCADHAFESGDLRKSFWGYLRCMAKSGPRVDTLALACRSLLGTELNAMLREWRRRSPH